MRDDVAWTRSREVVEMAEMLRSSEQYRASSVALRRENSALKGICNYACDRLILLCWRFVRRGTQLQYHPVSWKYEGSLVSNTV